MDFENREFEGQRSLEETLNILNEAADTVGGEVYKGYSGRGMFGQKCYGIVCDNPIACVETVAVKGITGANYDDMGLQYIVYWPRIKDEE